MAMERVHGVGVTLGVGTLEIGPAAEPEPARSERGSDRRSGAERRSRPGRLAAASRRRPGMLRHFIR